MEQLKPCPFCGGEAVLVETPALSFTDETQYPWQIYCTDCYCGTDYIANKEECVRRWNRRGDNA